MLDATLFEVTKKFHFCASFLILSDIDELNKKIRGAHETHLDLWHAVAIQTTMRAWRSV